MKLKEERDPASPALRIGEEGMGYGGRARKADIRLHSLASLGGWSSSQRIAKSRTRRQVRQPLNVLTCLHIYLDVSKPFSNSGHPGFHVVLQTHQVCSCLRTFALAVPFD